MTFKAQESCRLDPNQKANRLDRDNCLEAWRASTKPAPPETFTLRLPTTQASSQNRNGNSNSMRIVGHDPSDGGTGNLFQQ